MNPIDLANAEQRRASDPRVSAFVSASAGTGKTKLLTDRLLRLMLAGTAPDKILCLTYTKAAAAEMVLRLNRKLGEWVVMPEPALAAELRALDVPVQRLDLARKLFADVLDLPGGMRIETIHAFCQSLLRRFPLEAGLSPHFEVADEDRASLRLREAREAVLAGNGHRAAIFALAAETDEQSFAALTAELAKGESDVLRTAPADQLAAMLRAALGAGEGGSDAILREAVNWPREAHVRAVLRRLAELGNPSGQKFANGALEWLAQHPEDRAGAWEHWLCAHFTDKGKGGPNKLHNFFGKKLAAEEAAIRDELAKECERIQAVQEKLKAARLAELNVHLAGLAAPILHGEDLQKNLAAQLSYGDLVRRTGQLLIEPGAAWVLYKLDGGIDHLLLDEVQDTAPAQWEIAAAIAKEFFAGAGAREQKRSIFAVGDAKQSIFSFQGADLKSFETYREKFKAKVRDAGERWEDGALSVSFRSTAPVLALVDAVFAAGPARMGVAPPGEQLHHRLSRIGQAGCVTLWPLTRQAEPSALPDWQVPAEYEKAESAKAVLARDIAVHIQSRLGEMLPSRGRKVQPGDFLILVRRREALMGAITSELKRLKIPVAGVDRMVLTAQPAVSDLLALCDALLLPEDDLAFGQYLASPLGGLSDASLMELALGRRWDSLLAALYRRADERADWAAAKTYFEALRAKVDYFTPFALLSEALVEGRARLLRRLGAEAAEPIEELLTEALNYMQDEPGALQSFVHQLRQSGAMIKREAEAAGDVVRMMTVHGAKGLQAPIVILPDTTSLPDARQNLFWLPVPQQPGVSVPVFCPRSALRPGAVAAAAAAAQAAQAEEYNRLLYVALTRAEDELIICGAEGKKALPDTSWYARVKAGFENLPGVCELDGKWQLDCPQTDPADRGSTHATAPVVTMPAWAGAAPDWVMLPPAREGTRPERLAPSRSAQDDSKRAIAASPLAAGMAALRGARAAAMAKGSAVHALLQHLPDLAGPAREAAARHFLSRIAELHDKTEAVWGQVQAVLAHPELVELFGPGSRAEVPLAGIIGDVEIGGLVDRLTVTATRVLIADYKTDRNPPDRADDIPERYLRQLGAYRRILAEIYPSREIQAALIWTETALVMPVPHALLSRHAPA